MCGDPAVCMGQGTGHGACYFESFLTWQTGRRAGRKDGMGPVQKAYHFAKILISNRLTGLSEPVIWSACPMRQKGQLQVPACACLGNRLKCKTKFESELVCLLGRPAASRMCGTGKKVSEREVAAEICRTQPAWRAVHASAPCCAPGTAWSTTPGGPAPLGRPIGVSGSSCGDVRAQIGKSLRILVLDEGSHPRYHFLS